MTKLLLALAAIAVLLFPQAGADHCKDPYLERHSEELRFTDPTTGKLYYLENDDCQAEGCGAHFFLYEEANGYANLQRQDATGDKADEWTQDDTCHGKIRADKIVL